MPRKKPAPESTNGTATMERPPRDAREVDPDKNVRFSKPSQRGKEIPSAFEDSQVPPADKQREADPLVPLPDSPAKPVYGEGDPNFADLKKQVEQLGKKQRPPRARDADGRFLEADAEDEAAKQPEPKPEPDYDAESELPAQQRPRQEEPAAKEEDGLPQELLDEAETLFEATGLSKDDFTSAEALSRAVRKFDERLAKAGQKQPAQQKPAAAEEPPERKPEPTKPATAKTREQLEAILKRAEELDPDIGGALRAHAELQATEVGELKTMLKSMLEGRASVAAKDFESRFDDCCEKHPQFESILGKGRVGDVRGSQKFLRARYDVGLAMDSIAREHSAAGYPVPRDDVLFRKGVQRVFPEEVTQLAVNADRDERQAAARRRQGQFIERPTNVAGGREKTPAEKSTKEQRGDAIKAVGALFESWGVPHAE